MSNLKDLIDNPHPIYTRNVYYWDFLLNSYEGGIDYTLAKVNNVVTESAFSSFFKMFAGGEALRSKSIESNMFPHAKERSEDFSKRLEMSYYYNFCSPIIDTYTNHLFKLPVIAEYGSIETQVDKIKDNVDLMGSSIDEYRIQKSELAQVYGHIFTLVDSPQVNLEIRTMQDKFDNRVFPFFTLFRPQDVINWALDGFGRPHWVLVRETADINVDPFAFEKKDLKRVKYRLWTRTEWVLADSEGAEIERAPHGLGFVPINVTFDKKSKKARNFLGRSFIADIAEVARDLYNSCSELREIMRNQTFAFLVLQGDASDFNAIEVATNKGLRYPKDTNQPAFISPDAANADTYFKHIDRQVDKMFELAMLQAGSASFEGQSAVQESGVSKAWDFNQTNSALSKKAANLEDGEIKEWQMFAKWENKEWDGTIEYPHDFNVQDLIADLTEAKELLKMGLGEMFNTDIKRAIVKKKFPQKSDEDIDAMVAEFSDANATPNPLKDKAGAIFKNVIPDGKNEEEEDA